MDGNTHIGIDRLIANSTFDAAYPLHDVSYSEVFKYNNTVLIAVLCSCSRTRTLPYINKILNSNLSITTRQKLKEKLYYYRARFVLSEYIFTFEFCQAVIVIFVF